MHKLSIHSYICILSQCFKQSCHVPIMQEEVLEFLRPQNNKLYIDATFGAGGHSAKILESAQCTIYAFDRDPYVQQYVTYLQNKPKNQNRLYFYNTKFSQMDKVLTKENINGVDGILLDIGVSSMQLDQGHRGFSLKNNGDLKMTMGSNTTDASTLVNTLSVDKLSRIISEYGEEPKANKIARAIVEYRRNKNITTTEELKNIITGVLGRTRTRKIHSATLTFQALRIAVNDEMNELQNGIRSAVQLLNPGASLVIISFHALEDRIIKRLFFSIKTQHKDQYSLFNKGKAIKPQSYEIKVNPRARSAKIRVIKRNLN